MTVFCKISLSIGPRTPKTILSEVITKFCNFIFSANSRRRIFFARLSYQSKSLENIFPISFCANFHVLGSKDLFNFNYLSTLSQKGPNHKENLSFGSSHVTLFLPRDSTWQITFKNVAKVNFLITSLHKSFSKINSDSTEKRDNLCGINVPLVTPGWIF